MEGDLAQPNVSAVRVFSQNVAKNALHVDALLSELRNKFDVIFLQEPPWQAICHTTWSSEVLLETLCSSKHPSHWYNHAGYLSGRSHRITSHWRLNSHYPQSLKTSRGYLLQRAATRKRSSLNNSSGEFEAFALKHPQQLPR